jgi:hypothetical protein
MTKYLPAVLLTVSIAALSGCVSTERSARLARKEKEKELAIMKEARELILKHPEWDTLIAGPAKVETVYVPKIEYQTKVHTRVDTVTLYKYVDTLSRQLFGQIDDLQASLLKGAMLDIAKKMAAKSLPDTTITFSRRLIVTMGGSEIPVSDTVTLSIRGESGGYVFRVGNQEKKIPVETVTNEVTITPSHRFEDEFYHHWQWWALLVAAMGVGFIRFKR